MKNLYLLFILLGYVNLFLGQDFGEFTKQDLSMTGLPGNPDEDAIILLDQSEIKITNDFKLITQSRKRVKILTEEGKSYGDIKLVSWHEDEIYGIDAVCIDNKGVIHELDSDDIFNEEGEKTNTVSFAIPGISVGSVIEYKYTHYSDNISSLPEWYFQSDIFTVRSEVNVIIPPGFNYKSLANNCNEYNIKVYDETINDIGRSNRKLKKYTWIAKNVPGLEEEPFLDNFDDKFAKVQFVMESYKTSRHHITFAQSWNEISKKIYKRYDDFIDDDDLTEEKALQITSKDQTDLEKCKTIYNFIKNEIKTTKHNGIYGEDFKVPEEVLETMSGSSSEKNMLLINMLRNCGISANPLLISTRSNGKISQKYPGPYQFNRLLCHVNIKNQPYFLYTGQKSLPFNYLIPNMMAEVGFLVTEDYGKIIAVQPKIPRSKKNYFTEFNLDAEGVLKCRSTINYQGFPAFYERDKIENLSPEKLKDYMKEKLDVLRAESKLDSFKISGQDDINDPLEITLSYSLEEYVDETNDLIYFSFPMFSSQKENPFTKNRRYYDVEFDYPIKTNEEVKLFFPKDLNLVELPQKKKRQVSDFQFGKFYLNKENFVMCSRIENIKSRKFKVYFYEELKNLLDEIVVFDNEQLVFKRSTENNQLGLAK